MLCIVAFEGWHCQPGRAGKALSVSSLFQYHEVNMTKKKTNKNKQIQLAFEGWHCHCQARGKMCLCYNLFIVFPNFVMQRYIRKHCQRHNRLRVLSQSSHPRLQGDYTGHGKTPSRFLFFWPFLTKTKQEWPLPGHVHGYFLLGSLHLGAPYFDPDFPIILGYSHPESFFFK